MMQAVHWQLLAALADGRPHHVTELARRIGRKPPQLNALWQQVPPHIRGLLRQQDGRWRLNCCTNTPPATATSSPKPKPAARSTASSRLCTIKPKAEAARGAAGRAASANA